MVEHRTFNPLVIGSNPIMPNVKNIKCKMQNLKRNQIKTFKLNTGVTHKLTQQGQCLELTGPLGFGYVDLVKGKAFYNCVSEVNVKKFNNIQKKLLMVHFMLRKTVILTLFMFLVACEIYCLLKH